MSSGAADRSLREREKIRRRALWTLSDLLPGDPKAIPVVSVLDDIDRQDEADILMTPVVKVEALRRFVVTEFHSSNLQKLFGMSAFPNLGGNDFYKRVSVRLDRKRGRIFTT